MGKLKERLNEHKKTLKFSLVSYYMLIFSIFVGIFIVFTFFSLRDYYYNNLKANMLSQAEYSNKLYESYISSYTLNDVILNERFEFLNNIDGQVQILDNNAVILYDNTGSSDIGKITKDSGNLLGGKKTDSKKTFKFKIDNKNNTMHLNYPLTLNEDQIGILRINTSLDKINIEVNKRIALFVIFSLFLLILGFLSLFYFAGRVLNPINKLTNLANKLSDGQYSEKSNMEYSGEIGELAKTMDQLSENIVKKEEIKNDFISSVSHELRTPLTSIKGWALTLQDQSLDDETRSQGLAIIEHESDRLADMVEDLLDFSRFTSPSFTLNKTEFNLIPIIKNIVRQMRPRTVEKGINFIFDYNEEIMMIMGDENRLKQVFINIIDNAIKFTNSEGTILVSINKNYESNTVLCEISDTGIGISEEDIELVTTKFYKGTSKGSHTGLGLSISEEIILKHNGKLEISSILGEGTTLSFELPLIGEEHEKN